MATDYRSAAEVKTIANRLIVDVPDHKPLADARIEYVFRDKATKSRGRIVLGKARRITGLNAFLANAGEGPFFVIEIAEDTWRHLDDDGRKALVDHELCHLSVELDDDGEPELSLRGHDLEEFAGIIERHGLWKSDVAAFGTAVHEQLALAVDEVVKFVEDLDDKGDDDGPGDA